VIDELARSATLVVLGPLSSAPLIPPRPPRPPLEVTAFRGVERLDEPYVYTIDFTDDAEHALEDELPGLAAALVYTSGARSRLVHGVVASVCAVGRLRVADAWRTRFRAELVPRAWLLGQRRTSRVFQGMRVDQIVSRVLDEAGVRVELRLEARLPTRELVVQLEETDLAFVGRLLAEHGITYYFDQPAEALGALAEGRLGERMILTDHAGGYSPLPLGAPLATAPGRLRMRSSDLSEPASDTTLDALSRACRVAPREAVFHERDARRPHHRLASGLVQEERERRVSAESELYDERPLTLYEHHTSDAFPDWEHERTTPRRMLESARAHRDVASGSGSCPWLTAGHVFRLEGHELERLDGEWALTSVEHHAVFEGGGGKPTYESSFECVRAGTLRLPPRPPRRHVDTCVTATVVGGDGSGIATNRDAQVRVRFHWDRRRAADAGEGSCWIRVMQPWAGSGFGFQFIPRVGMEVVVGFEGGDPDRPIALGCVYNGSSPAPFQLPQHATRSGLRTRTAPGAGAHELWFDDAPGAERVYLQSERDLELHAKNDRLTQIGGDDVTEVSRNQSVRLGGAAALAVAGFRETRVGVDDRREVLGQSVDHVHEGRRERTDGDLEREVGGATREELHGAVSRTAHRDVLERVHGNHVLVVGKGDAKRSAATHVEGSLRTTATERIELRADQELLLVVGKTELRLSPDGATLRSPELGLFAEGARLRLAAKTLKGFAEDKAQLKSEKVTLRSSGASLGLGDEATMSGAKIKLGSAADADDEHEEASVELTVIELTDDDGHPLGGQTFRLVFPDGRELSGALDQHGRAELELDEEAEIHFPGLPQVRKS
jgi:type VI secretion system secreted protein VgrG